MCVVDELLYITEIHINLLSTSMAAIRLYVF